MPTKHTFVAIIQNPGKGGAFVEVPFNVEEAFGSKRPKVKATIDGVPYRGSLVRMGIECHILGVRKEICEQIGKTFGDEVAISVELDTKRRTVEIPTALMRALETNPEAKSNFENLSNTHQREYVIWIEEAKKEETRQTRIKKSIELLKQKKKTR